MPVARAFTYQTVSSGALYGTLEFGALGHKDVWKNSLFIPLLTSAASFSLLFIQASRYLWRKRRLSRAEATPARTAAQYEVSLITKVKGYVDGHGGITIFSFNAARTSGSFILLGLSIFTLLHIKGQDTGEFEKHKRASLAELGLVATYWYTSILASLTLKPGKFSPVITRHLNTVLFVTLGVYFYRDIWPLATYDKHPIDVREGPFLWAKIAILGLAGVIVPLFIPRKYIPVDPKEPMPEPNPEQTASLWSLMVYTFLDKIIFEAYRVPHLSHERLPPLCDYDRSKILTKGAFPYVDPFHGARDRHMFFSIVQYFAWDFFIQGIALVGQVLANFASPVAINRILVYLETDGKESYLRPWVWVVLLFFGPLGSSIFFQWYIFISTRTLARCQAILTQLIFEHSLRVRFKAETTSENKASSERSSSVVEHEPEPSGITTIVAEPSSDNQSLHSETTVQEAAQAKGKDATDKDTATEPKKKDNLVGKINNLVTVDVENMMNSKDFLMVFLQIPVELGLAIAFLYIVLGWSAFVGLVSIVLLIPVPGYVASLMQTVAQKKMEKTDARVETVTETLGVLRMIKLFGWEGKINENLKEIREEELKWVFKDKTLSTLNDVFNSVIPVITMVVTYATYTLIMKESLNASKVFSSMAVFDIVRGQLHRTSWFFAMMIKGKVSLDRINEFLRKTELLDQYSEETHTEVIVANNVVDKGALGFNNAIFAWSKDAEDGAQTPSGRSFRLRVDGNLTFKKGGLNLIIGPTGSGKTSILMALLGEMHFMPPNADSWFNLPREAGVAYAAQESWVQNLTIRENIVFGSPFDEERYKKVIQQCALERDLELFEAGDKTEVGEKGLTLSGGQKARVTLARAVYSTAQVVLLDDILAALDVHTSKHIVNECLRGDLLQGRTILLVTHNVALTSPLAEKIVAIGLDGYAREVSDLSEVIAHDKKLAQEIEKAEDQAEVEEEVVDDVKKDTKELDGKLILAEEIQEGRVTWKAINLFARGLGGDAPIFFLTLWFGGLALSQAAYMFSVWFLGYWGSQYESYDPSQIDVPYFLGTYSMLLLLGMAIYGIVSQFFNIGTQRSSRYINEKLTDSVLGSTLRWLDETPVSRIITRCTQDIGTVDGQLPWAAAAIADLFASIIIKLAGPVIYSPIFLLPGIIIFVFGVYIGNIYLKAQMSVKREMSNARSPVLAHLGAAIQGLVSIRAYGAEQAFKADSLTRIDHYTKIGRTSFNLNRWVGIRIDLLGAVFVTSLASYLLTTKKINAANTGFSLNMALEFCSMILWLVRFYNDFEVQANSLERIQAYLDIEHEPKPTPAGQPPAAWPTSGELRVEKLSARYSPTGPKVLHDLTFTVKSGERVGIVGRTGSGKSSLTLSLLRLILTEGTVYYDGLDTSTLNLDALRSSITIIPQVPELLSGTLRKNLDPFSQNDDATLNSALRSSGLFTLQTETDEARLTLDSDISSGGNNLSVGQRQIIALARAIVRSSKLLILDEATSAIDHKTDSIIQSTLRNELANDVTVLTVAHRLQTIMDADKIMVLDAGTIVEFDSPRVLLAKKGGYFKSLVEGSGDRKALYSMASKS